MTSNQITSFHSLSAETLRHIISEYLSMRLCSNAKQKKKWVSSFYLLWEWRNSRIWLWISDFTTSLILLESSQRRPLHSRAKSQAASNTSCQTKKFTQFQVVRLTIMVFRYGERFYWKKRKDRFCYFWRKFIVEVSLSHFDSLQISLPKPYLQETMHFYPSAREPDEPGSEDSIHAFKL